MIERFTVDEFEQAIAYLPFEALGVVKNEYSYRIKLDGQSGILIRSSVKDSGISAGTSKDSIRVWLVDNSDKPLAAKTFRWVTRQPGWQQRLQDKISEIAKYRTITGDCLECDKPKGIFKVKKQNENKGRLFSKCFNCNGDMTWLDEVTIGDASKVYFSDASKEKVTKEEKLNIFVKFLNEESDISQEEIKQQEEMAKAQEIKPKEKPSDNGLQLNDEQKQAVEMPLDANYRVLAGPGAGKTTGVIVPRYCYLIENGIEAESILAVAFNKNMADELLTKISKTIDNLSDEAKNQICTIHAFCYRQLLAYWRKNNKKILSRYDHKNPYHRSAKKPEWLLKDIISEVWAGEERKAGWKEVMVWINAAKFNGLTIEQSKEFFCKAIPQPRFCNGRLGHLVHIAREKYDQAMQIQGTLDFADMLYLVERLLIEDSDFRNGLQAAFSHVLVDEAQDVGEQALRILVTISQDMGWNKIYKNRV